MTKRYFRLAVIGCCTLLLTSCGVQKKKILPPPPPVVEVPRVEVETETPMDQEQGTDFVSPQAQVSTLPDSDYVAERIRAYNSKLERWKELDKQAMAAEYDKAASDEMVNCLRGLQRLTNGYKRIQSVLLRQEDTGPAISISTQEVMQLEQLDIAFLESSCGRLLRSDGDGAGRSAVTVVDLPAESPMLESQVRELYSRGEFEEVVNTYQKMPATQADHLGVTTRIAYAKALMALNRQSEAAVALQEIVSDDVYPDRLTISKDLADLYLATGRYDLARSQYREVANAYNRLGEQQSLAAAQLALLETGGSGSPELQKYGALLGNYLSYNPQRDGYKVVWQAEAYLAAYPLSTLSGHVETIRASSQNQADRWLADFVAEVDEMAEGNQFQEALAKLEGLPEGVVSPELAGELRAKRDDLALASAMNREARKQQQLMVNEQQWGEALALIDSQNYDEAIEVLTTMLDSDYSAQAEKKIAEASLLAARAERRKAADLFIQYTRASDIEEKKRLLIDSRRHLIDITIKYPNVSILDKVRGNIGRVEKEMNKIDPDLLAQAETVGDNGDGSVEQEEDTLERVPQQ